jgi:hypothetical protein
VLVPQFPTAIVYLDPTASDRAIESALGLLVGLLDELPAAPTRADYALALAHNATLTQGFTLYKRWLALVGLLDELYDPAFDHALARRSRLAPLFA